MHQNASLCRISLMNKIILALVTTAVVIGGTAFYGGMKYSQSGGFASGPKNFADLTPEERQQRLQQFGGRGRGNGGQGGGFISGEIIGKDDKSVTVKSNNGSSKIIFISDTTKVTQSMAGSLNELIVGKQVTVNGTTNQDGSVTAQTVQIRPVPQNTQPNQ